MPLARAARGLLVLTMLVPLAAGCGSGGGDGGAGAGTPTPVPGPSPTPGFADALGFVVSSFGFVFPDAGGAEDCLAPDAGAADPEFRTMDAPAALAGFDLDTATSTKDAPQPGECAHDDFGGPGGEAGFDDQLWRAIGCIRGFQPGDAVEGVVEAAVRDGSMTILADVRGVDNPRNDDDVEVQLFSSRDAPPLGGDGSVLPYGTLSVDPDPRYHSTVGRGRIVDGQVVAGPMDIRLRLNIQIVVGDLTFRDAYVRLDLADDGTASGGIYGYAPLDDVYEIFGRQAGTIGGKEALGYSCAGLYAALASQADGHFDPASGSCSSLSTAYRFAGIPAFVAR
jgi:hypothetical protein